MGRPRKYATEQERREAKRAAQREASRRYLQTPKGKQMRAAKDRRRRRRIVEGDDPARRAHLLEVERANTRRYRQSPKGREVKRLGARRHRARQRMTPQDEAAELAGAVTHAEDAARRYMAARASFVRIEHDPSVTPARKRAIAANVRELYEEAIAARGRAMSLRRGMERRRRIE